MADQIWVYPVVTGAEVATPPRACESCAALLIKLTVGGLHDRGAVQLPDILICPDCHSLEQVVDEWRSKLQR